MVTNREKNRARRQGPTSLLGKVGLVLSLVAWVAYLILVNSKAC